GVPFAQPGRRDGGAAVDVPESGVHECESRRVTDAGIGLRVADENPGGHDAPSPPRGLQATVRWLRHATEGGQAKSAPSARALSLAMAHYAALRGRSAARVSACQTHLPLMPARFTGAG